MTYKRTKLDIYASVHDLISYLANMSILFIKMKLVLHQISVRRAQVRLPKVACSAAISGQV
jgi:hypothetical protein